MMQRTGIYGLFRFDGGPLSVPDRTALGLSLDQSDCAMVRPIDRLEPCSIAQASTPDAYTILLGHIDDQAELALRLSQPPDAPTVTIALAALERFGADLPREMFGGWTLLRWERQARRLRIVQSLNLRNTMLIARSGANFACAPDLLALTRIGWIGDELDPEGLTGSLLNRRLAPRQSERLFIRGVRSLGSGGTLVCDEDGEQISQCDPHLPVRRWSGSFDEAVESAEALLRQQVGGVFQRGGKVGTLNSGGLDSSMLAWLASSEKSAGQTIPQLCSALAAGRGLADELPFARIVAEHLGEPVYPVIPSADANPFRPRLRDFAASHAPPLSPRHYLYDSLADQAVALGVTHLLDGGLGELTVTAHYELTDWRKLARFKLGALVRRLRYSDVLSHWPDVASPVMLAPAVNAGLPTEFEQRLRQSGEASVIRRRGQPWGYPSDLKGLIDRHAVELCPGRVNRVMPFTDIRLLQLFAGFPIEFVAQAGLSRAPARHMLRGQLPDSIVMRPKGLAFSPDYHLRLAEHAAAAAARVPLFRLAGLQHWFDLDRLETGLAAMSVLGPPQVASAFKVQLTMHACEFVLWWLSGRPVET